ncbi:MAG: hypothetical protein JO121_23480 [Deltaproteobacteria bacterium]|jgi:uncharacterized membrane protein YkvA (DUF1232 family)|nr:hypothetical protein [Deltaproteobacteria bacterium]
MFWQFLRMHFLPPLQLSRLVGYLPQFVRVFWRLMKDPRVPLLAKLVPVLALLLMVSPPAIELDLVPILGEIGWLVVGVVAFKILVWLSPPEVVREHVSRIARGQ